MPHGFEQARTSVFGARKQISEEAVDVRRNARRFGFQPEANLDEGQMWPIAFAVTDLTPAVERRIVELVKQAAG